MRWTRPCPTLPGLIQLPARDGAYKSRCSVLDVMEASTRLINAVPPDVVLAACRALRMAAAAITYLLRSVDVGAQAPTPALGKMASWPSCAMLCKDTGRKYRPLFSLLLFSLAKSLTRLEELRDERNLRPKIGSPTPLHYPLPGSCQLDLRTSQDTRLNFVRLLSCDTKRASRRRL